MIRLLRTAVAAPAALAVAAMLPSVHSSAAAPAAHASARGHGRAPTAIPAPRVGDLTVTVLSVTTQGRATPQLRFTTPDRHRPTVYGAVTAVSAHRYVARVVVLRRAGDSGAPLTWSFGSEARGDLQWQARDVLHHADVEPGLLDAGADPRVVCRSFSARFHHVAGRTLSMPARTFGTDGCLLAAHAKEPMPGLQKATHLTVPAGFLSEYPKVSVRVAGDGAVVGPLEAIACGSACTGYARAGRGGVLTALPSRGWSFAGWSGACSGTGTCAVKGTAPFTAHATFTLDEGVSSPSPTPAPLPHRTGVQLYEFGMYVARTTVAAGSVEIDAANIGEDDHQLSVRDRNGTVLATTALLHPHDEAVLDVALAPGTYTVFCPTANHEQLGMVTTLTVS